MEEILTIRMMMILELVMKRNEDGSLKDLDQLINEVDYDVTKQAIQHTIRFLIQKRMMSKAGTERRRGRRRVVYRATELAYKTLRHGNSEINS